MVLTVYKDHAQKAIQLSKHRASAAVSSKLITSIEIIIIANYGCFYKQLLFSSVQKMTNKVMLGCRLCATHKREYIVLVDLNEFPSIFQKVQHSHSRQQKTTSNLIRINLKGILEVQ